MAILVYIFIIVLPIVLLTLGLRYWIGRESKKEKEDKDKPRNRTAAYIYNYSGPLKGVGFITAIIFCIALWNFRYEFKVVIEAEKEKELIMDLFDLSINTEQKKPPKPKPILTPKIIEAPEEEIEEKKELAFKEEPEEEIDPVQGLEGDDEGEDEEIVFDDKIYSTAELQHLPGFPGGKAGLSAYMSRNMKIPPSVRKRGVTGKIYVGFVIGKDGKVTDVTILRGLTPAMDKEAVRVVKNMPAWDPGYNGGIAVKVRQSLPIKIAY
jgi:protein TonB